MQSVNKSHPSSSEEGIKGWWRCVRIARVSDRWHETTPTQFQVKLPPAVSDQSGGLIDLKLLKRRG